MIADLTENPLQIINGVQIFCELLPVNVASAKLLHKVLPPENFRLVNERLLQIPAEKSCAHGGFGLVQHPEQRALFLLFPHGLTELQIPLGGGIDDHELGALVITDIRDMIDRALLGIINIAKGRCGRKTGMLPVRKPQSGKPCMEMLFQQLPGLFLTVVLLRKLCDDEVKAILQLLRIDTGFEKIMIHQKLRRREATQLIINGTAFSTARGEKFTGGNVNGGNTEAPGVTEDTHEEVVLSLLQRSL